MAKVLPELKSREDVQAYLRSVAEEVGVALESSEVAAELDRRDQLAGFRDKFHVPTIAQLLEQDETDPCVDVSKSCMYFTGNSTGLQPRNTLQEVEREMEKWALKGSKGHVVGKIPWYVIEDVIAKTSAEVMGCKPEEVTAMNTLSVNIHFALASFYQPTKERYKILLEDRCFPSDLFAMQSQARWHGYDPDLALVKVPSREGELLWRTEDIVKVIEEEGDSIALVFFSGVHYATGHLFDMEAITKAAHSKGICAGFDLAHAAGNVELQLHEWDVDFAVWCSYKYLNSGPGGIAGFYVHERHGNNPKLPRLMGWWSHNRETRLKMGEELDLVLGARGFHVSNPPVLQCVLLKASLDVFAQTSMRELRCKSRILTGYLELLLEQNLSKEAMEREGRSGDKYVTIVTSQDPTLRGCQLSLQFSWPIEDVHTFLKRRGVVSDLREPSVMRVAPVPLYNSFTDVQRFYQVLREAVQAETD